MGIIHTAKKNIKAELFAKMAAEALEKQRCKNANITSLRVSQETQVIAYLVTFFADNVDLTISLMVYSNRE